MSPDMLRGRKRFTADLKDAIAASQVRPEQSSDATFIPDLRRGEDSETFVCTVRDHAGLDIASFAFTTTPEEYPDDHEFICYIHEDDTDDTFDPPGYIKAIASSVQDYGSISIASLLQTVLTKISSFSDQSNEESSGGVDSIDAGFTEESYEEYSDDELDFALPIHNLTMDWSILQRHFHETIAAGYQPGFIRLETNFVALSVSLPIIKLASNIEPRALMAWDTRLLSKSQHLTLVITGLHHKYPALDPDGCLDAHIRNLGTKNLQFRVGLTPRYKPDDSTLMEILRRPDLDKDLEDPQLAEDLRLAENLQHEEYSQPEILDEQGGSNVSASNVPVLNNHVPLDSLNGGELTIPEEGVDVTSTSRFSFSLSESLELLFQERFLQTVQLRLRYGIGWSAAELLISRAERAQRKPESMYDAHILPELLEADEEETKLASSYGLPSDPLLDSFRDHPNLLLIAFSYLIRRLTLCSRYCLICHNRLSVDFDALKPYVCDDPLCAFRYYHFKRGPSLEHEICTRPTTVDLLVSLAYCAAASRTLDEPLPTGIGLMVPCSTDPNGLFRRFDDMGKDEMCKAVTDTLTMLPPVAEMKRYLESGIKLGRVRRIENMDPSIPPAAWLLLRWCISSCTAHIEELEAEDCISDFTGGWRQFRLVVGAPDAEAKLTEWKKKAADQNANAARYPTLLAFHGSATQNWHSIVRHGLWHKVAVHGRAHGNGVYFSKNAMFSINNYSQASNHYWQNSALQVHRCVAMAEIINLPGQFVSSSPHFVVANTEWIVCRYLLVNCMSLGYQVESKSNTGEPSHVPSVLVDPVHPPTLNTKVLNIPEPDYKLQQMLEARRAEDIEYDLDEDDVKICDGIDPDSSPESPMTPVLDSLSVKEDWKHDPSWVASCTPHLLPPPETASVMATKAIQRELTTMLKEQNNAKRLDELGWYIPQDSIGDNLFQWIIEFHSFPKDLPISQDMEREGINSIVMEVDFPPTFPFSPPFFRILKPRLLSFMQHGGGHVTSGGTMCMELLTSTGWLASYSIPSVIVDVKLAIADMEPYPARLSPDWRRPYSMPDAVESYKRVALSHGWKVPKELDFLLH